MERERETHLAMLIHDPDVELCVADPLLRGLQIPLHGQRVVLGRPAAVVVHEPEVAWEFGLMDGRWMDGLDRFENE